MLPLYSRIYLISLQSHIHQKWFPQRKCLSWTIAHLPADVSPTKEWYLRSKSVHDRDPNLTGRNITPSLQKSNKHYPVLNKFFVAFCDSASSVGYIKIHPIPSALWYVIRKVGLSGSNLVKTGEGVIVTLSSSKSEIRSDVHTSFGIDFLSYIKTIAARVSIWFPCTERIYDKS